MLKNLSTTANLSIKATFLFLLGGHYLRQVFTVNALKIFLQFTIVFTDPRKVCTEKKICVFSLSFYFTYTI